MRKGVEGGREGGDWKTEKGKSFSEKVVLGEIGGGGTHPLLISKRGSCLKFGCLALLASNATRDVAMKF